MINLFIGGVISLFGSVLHDGAGMRALGNIIVILGGAYAVISIIIILFKGDPLSLVSKTISEREKNKAQDELFKYKKLLDEGIITKNEYDQTVDKLKKKIL
jgi:hypothetical protein